MANIPDISQLQIADLETLRTAVYDRIDEIQKEAVKKLRDRFKKEAAAAGLSLGEVLGMPRKLRAGSHRSKAPMKYISRDGSKEWSGRGRQPKFVVEHLASGGKLEDLLIKNVAA